jgi:hypothetical protein
MFTMKFNAPCFSSKLVLLRDAKGIETLLFSGGSTWTRQGQKIRSAPLPLVEASDPARQRTVA